MLTRTSHLVKILIMYLVFNIISTCGAACTGRASKARMLNTICPFWADRCVREKVRDLQAGCHRDMDVQRTQPPCLATIYRYFLSQL